MMPYKVALIHNIISPYRVPLFEELANQEFLELFVYYCSTIDKNRKWDVIESDKYTYKILPGLKLEFKDMNLNFNPAILKELVKSDYDIIIIGGCADFTTQLAFLLSKLKNIPIILWSEGIESAQSLLGKVMNPLTDTVIKNSDALIVPGSRSREFHIKRGASPDKIYIAPNIIDNNIYRTQSNSNREYPTMIKEELGLSHDRIILFVGRLTENKGVHFLLNAYRRLKDETSIDVCLVIVGDGPLKEMLLEKCVKDNIKDVYFTGWLNGNEKIKYYSISNLFVLPTLSDVWGLVINEAMCSSLPVITTNAAGCATDMIIQGVNGFIVEPANEGQLYSAIKEIILNDELSQKMGRKSLDIILNKFNVEKMAEGFILALEYSMRNH